MANGGEVEYHFKGEDKQLKKVMGNVSSKVGGLAKGLVKGFAGVTAGIGLASIAVGGLVKKSLDAFAENEQLVGGIDTLFKNNSKDLQRYADVAYKTAGISANKYMEVATSFSASLLQSLKGDTAKAVSYTDRAIVDMSDNANKMGTSIESIQNAYQGFAKQNYTMLDNLKLGYGGTKSEMERLIADANKVKQANGEMADLSINSFADVTEAIHIIQTEMGITGTTAKEASETISGSVGMMKGAWNNFVTSLGQDSANFEVLTKNLVEAIATVGKNILPRIGQIINSIATALPSLINSLTPIILEQIPILANTLIPQIINTASSLYNMLIQTLIALIPTIIQILPSLIQSFFDIAMNIMNSILTSLPTIFEQIQTAIITLIPQFVNMLPTLLQTYMQIIVELVNNIIALIPSLVQQIETLIVTLIPTFIQMLPTLISTFFQMVSAVANGIIELIPVLIPQIVDTIMGIVNALLDNIDLLIDTGINLLLALVDGIIQAVPLLLEKIPEIIQKLLNGLVRNFPKIAQAGGQLVESLVSGVISLIPQVINAALDIIATFKEYFAQMRSMALDAAKNVIRGLVNGIKNGIGAIGDAMKSLARNALNSFKRMFGIHSPSKVMFEMGNYTDEGFINGVEDMQKDVDEAFTGMFDLSPNLYDNASTHFSPSVNVNVTNNMEQDPLGLMVNKIKTMSGGSKNDYNYGMGVA